MSVLRAVRPSVGRSVDDAFAFGLLGATNGRVSGLVCTTYLWKIITDIFSGTLTSPFSFSSSPFDTRTHTRIHNHQFRMS